MNVYENAIGPNVCSEINYLLKNKDIQWSHNATTSYTDSDNLYDYHFYHVLYDETPKSQLFAPFYLMFLNCLDSAGQKLDTLFRLRLSMHTALPNRVEHEPHVDGHEPHITGILYINDSDGDTVVYNEKYDMLSGKSTKDYLQKINLTEQGRASPKQGTFITFDGLQYHNGCTPLKTQTRILMNCNYKPK